MKFLVVFHDPETKTERTATFEAESHAEMIRTAREVYKRPRRVIPVRDGAVPFVKMAQKPNPRTISGV